MNKKPLIVMGIDPGINKTGVGLLAAIPGKVKYIHHAVLTSSPKAPMVERLAEIIHGMNALVDEYQPMVAAVEDIFFSVNVKSAITLGQTRGAILGALILKQLPVREFSALHIKKAVVGYGKADKNQVKMLMEIHLNRKFDGVPLDATDALACALCLALTETGRLF